METLNLGLLWLIISGTVSTIVGHLTNENVGEWTGSVMFFGGLTLAVAAWFRSEPVRPAGNPADIPVHQDMLASVDTDG